MKHIDYITKRGYEYRIVYRLIGLFKYGWDILIKKSEKEDDYLWLTFGWERTVTPKQIMTCILRGYSENKDEYNVEHNINLNTYHHEVHEAAKKENEQVKLSISPEYEIFARGFAKGKAEKQREMLNNSGYPYFQRIMQYIDERVDSDELVTRDDAEAFFAECEIVFSRLEELESKCEELCDKHGFKVEIEE